MNEMIARVAGAIQDRMLNHGWDRPGELARAAIEAMREPTKAMIGAANRNNHPRDIDTWTTMIDEAMRDG